MASAAVVGLPSPADVEAACAAAAAAAAAAGSARRAAAAAEAAAKAAMASLFVRAEDRAASSRAASSSDGGGGRRRRRARRRRAAAALKTSDFNGEEELTDQSPVASGALAAPPQPPGGGVDSALGGGGVRAPTAAAELGARRQSLAAKAASKCSPSSPASSEVERPTDAMMVSAVGTRSVSLAVAKSSYLPEAEIVDDVLTGPNGKEIDMMHWWRRKLQCLRAVSADTYMGPITVVDPLEIGGEARVVHDCGTPCPLFDIHLTLTFHLGALGGDFPGKVKVQLSNGTAAELAVFPVEVVAIANVYEHMVQANLVPKLREVLREYIAEYEAMVREGSQSSVR